MSSSSISNNMSSSYHENYLKAWKSLTPKKIEITGRLETFENQSNQSKFNSGISCEIIIKKELTDSKLEKLLMSFLPLMSIDEYDWERHIYTLIQLEKKFRISSTFSFDKSITIFHEHIEQIKKIGFDITMTSKRRVTEPDEPGTRDIHLTVIGIAAAYLSPVLLQSFYKAGADPKIGEKIVPVDNQYSRFRILQYEIPLTPLDLMVQICRNDDIKSFDQCLAFLTSHGCDPNGLQQDWYLPPLGWAFLDGNFHFARSLLKSGADIHWQKANPSFNLLRCLHHHERYSNLLEVAITEMTYNQNVTYKGVKGVTIPMLAKIMSLGIELFASNIIHDTLKTRSACNYTENETRAMNFLYETSKAYIGHIKVCVNSKLGVSALTEIVGGYLNLPTIESLTYPCFLSSKLIKKYSSSRLSI